MSRTCHKNARQTDRLVVSGVIAAFAIGDMVVHNRRKRNEWLADQQAKSAVLLEEARKASETGPVTDDQMLLLNRERAAQEAEAEKKSRRGIFGKAKDSLFGGLSKEEVPGGKLGQETREAQERSTSSGLGIMSAVSEQRAQGESAEAIVHPSGGPLDRQAAASAEKASQTARGWSSWLSGR